MDSRDNQHGGIVVFAVIGVLLVGLLAGALYMGRQQARIAEENTPAPIAIDTEKDATDATGEEKPAAAPAKDESETKPAPAPTPKPQTPVTTPTPAAPRVATVPTSGPSEALPSTGPSDTLLSVGIIVAISFVGFAFVQSNARLRRSALNR